MRKYKYLVCVSLLLSCMVGLSTKQVVAASDMGNPANSSGYDLVSAVNALRASSGLPLYNVNSILMTIAQNQADYLSSTGGAYGHIGLGGTLPYQRALNAGYSVGGQIPPGLFSENWDASSSIQAAITAWEGDSAHRIALYSTNLVDIGGGVASRNGMNYYVIDTGTSTGARVPAGPTSSTTNSTSSANSSSAISSTSVSQSQVIPMAIVSTPDEAGNVYHLVEPGQALWQIAIAYKVKINDIMSLNHLSSNVIYPGQKLLIMRTGTATPLSPTPRPTLDLATFTPLPTLEIFTETATGTATATQTPAIQDRGEAPVVGGIILAALIAAGLLAWVGRQRPV